MATTVESLIQEYARRYSAQDADGVTALCEAPFLAIREGRAIHLPDREAVREHFATTWCLRGAHVCVGCLRGAGGT